MVVEKLRQRCPSHTALLMLLNAFSGQMSSSSTTHHVHNQGRRGIRTWRSRRSLAQDWSSRDEHAAWSTEFPTFQEIREVEAEHRYAFFYQDQKYQVAVREHPRRARDGVQMAILGSSEKYQH